MRNLRQATLLAGAGLLLLVPLAFAATDAEFKCEASLSKATVKFVGAKSKCVMKCLANAWKGVAGFPFSDCQPPYGGITAQCIDDTVLDTKGAEDKLRDAIRKACDPTFKVGSTVQCPACYSGGDCTAASGHATDWVQHVEGNVDSFVPGVGCETTGADIGEQKCQTATAKALTKQVGGVGKCYDKCNANIHKSLIPAGSCDPPASDPATAACIAGVDGKAILAVDKACGAECVGGSCVGGATPGASCTQHSDCGPQANMPDCPNPDDYGGNHGSQWVNLVDIAISGDVPMEYCQ